MASNVVYQFILDCSNFTKDVYWKDILYSCACNKFPKGMKYNHMKQIMYVRSIASGKIKTETLTISQNPEECYNTLIYIFKTLLGLKSDEDIRASVHEIEEARKNNDVNLDCDWKKLKPKSVKNHILMNFAITKIIQDRSDEAETNDKDVIKLYRTIQLGMQFKYLSPEDFDYQNGVINSIKGLDYDKELNKFILTNKQGAIPHTSQNKPIHSPTEKAVVKWAKQLL
jgi:hypothetical protein